MAVRHEGPGHLHTAGPHAPTRASTRGHDIFRPPAFASRSSDSRRGIGPSSRSAHRPQAAGPRRGYRVPHARAATGVGALSTPRTTVLTPTGVASPAGACRFTAASPCTPPQHPTSRGSRFTRHQRGFTQVHPSGLPLACGRPDGTGALGLSPGLRTPPTRSRTTHVRGGDRPSSTDLELPLNVIIRRSPIRVVHSMRATSRRTRHCRSPRSGETLLRRDARWSSDATLAGGLA